jgi:beta-lactamase regulating signal transducer with metallopeptidase domain
MRRYVTVAGHASVLALLVAGAGYAVVILVSDVMMLIGTVLGYMPIADASPRQIALGVLMVLLWGAVAGAGLAVLWRQHRAGRHLARWVARTATAPSPRLAAAAARVGSSGWVVEVADPAPYAFTYGVWHSRVVVSSGLTEVATRDELVAVLHHEHHHLRHRDPLTVLAVRSWAAALFPVPLVGAVLQRILDQQELRADRAALDACGVAPVAGALLKAVGEPAVAPGTALAAMGGPHLLEARVAQLETGDRPRMLAAIPRATILASMPGLGLIAGYGVLLYQVCLAVEVCCAT